MGIIGSAIGAGIGAVGSIFGGISASKAMRQVRSNIEQQRADNRNWYDRNYNTDFTQRSQAQAALRHMEDSIRQGRQASAGQRAVAGATEESAAAEKAANAAAMAQVATNLAVTGEQHKDAVESQYQAKDDALQGQLNDLQVQKARNTAAAINGVAQSAANIGGLF